MDVVSPYLCVTKPKINKMIEEKKPSRVIGYKEELIVEIIQKLGKVPFEMADPIAYVLRTQGVEVELQEKKEESEILQSIN